jgi:anti-sigma regulatory factor (Ser/Thr protein kinase)
MIDLFIPMGKDILIEIVDEGFGVGDLHQQCRRGNSESRVS